MRPLAFALVLGLAGCTADGCAGAGPTPDSGAGADSADTSAEVLPTGGAAWVRDELESPGPITFTELMVAPAAGGAEWVELHNPMVFDVDVSGWSLQGAVEYTFPEGTRLGPDGWLVVAADPAAVGVADALGPWSGRLDDAGERLRLVNNGGRRIDYVAWGVDTPWPAGAFGTGATLAKRRPDLPSDHAESWTASAPVGGTPGGDNAVDLDAPPVRVALVAADAPWRYDTSGADPDPDWAAPAFDDRTWPEGVAPFTDAGEPAPTEAIVRITADNYYAVYLGAADGHDLRLLAEDADGDWTTTEEVLADVTPDDHLFYAAWELPTDSGGPQMVIAQTQVGGEVVGSGVDTVEVVLGAVDAAPGASPPAAAPAVAEVAARVAEADADGTWAAPAVEADRASSPWGWALSGSFGADTRYVWPDTFGDVSATNDARTYALFRSVAPVSPEPPGTVLEPVPALLRLRTDFELDADPTDTTLWLSCEVDAPVAVYLNGVLVLEEPAPGGVWGSEVPTDALVRGDNRLAVELRPEAGALRFACALDARVAVAADAPPVRLGEVPAAGEGGWIELEGTGQGAVDATAMVLTTSGGARVVLPAGTVPGDGRLLVDGLDLDPAAGELLALYDADESVLLDAVRAADTPRSRLVDGRWATPDAASPGEPDPVTLEADVVVSELMVDRPGSAEEWVELTNRGDAAVDLSGWQLRDAVGFVFPDGTTLAPGAALVVAADAAALRAAEPGVDVLGDYEGRLDNAGERVELVDARGNPADEVPYADGGRWPPTGQGASLELRDLRADNAAGEAWAPSDERARTAWEEVSIEGVAEPSVVGPDGQWHELVLGLLDEGEVLLDDVSLVRDPGGAAVEVLRDGTFDDPDAWRRLGTHRHSEVVDDPDEPGNPVLRLVATGPTEHMHNHVETTLTEPIATTRYALRFRARWLAGDAHLNTRLYFNRLPRTTVLTRPARAGTPGAPNSTAVANAGPTFAELAPDVVVPAAGEPLRMSVTVADPDGVATVTLWWARDGEAFSAAPMAEGADGRWSATVAGQEAGTLVHLYVEATDAEGVTSLHPAAGPDARALLTWDDGRAATNGLHTFRLLMTTADHDWLLDEPNLMSNDALGASVVYDEREWYPDVGVRAKGSERGRPEVPRLGYGVKFARDARFRGSHTSVLLDRSEGVGYGQRELLANLVGARVGLESAEYHDLAQLVSPRAEHTGPAELQLDRASDLVLAAQFTDGELGPLYDYELVYYPLTTDDGTPDGQKLPAPDSVVGTAITDLGDDPEGWRWSFMLQNQVAADDFGPVMDLGRTFALADDDFLELVGDVADVDQWLRAYAFASLVGAVDNYAGDGSQHNARLYARPEDGRLLLFPHDQDFFGGPTNAVAANPDLRRLLADPVHLRTYHQALWDLSERAYTTAYLGPWCDRFTELTGQPFDSHCAFVDTRREYVLRGAADAVLTAHPVAEFAITTADGEDFTAAASPVTLRGVGWIDVHAIEAGGAALEVRWLDGETWEAEVPLVDGANPLTLTALDGVGAPVGSDTIVVTLAP